MHHGGRVVERSIFLTRSAWVTGIPPMVGRSDVEAGAAHVGVGAADGGEGGGGGVFVEDDLAEAVVGGRGAGTGDVDGGVDVVHEAVGGGAKGVEGGPGGAVGVGAGAEIDQEVVAHVVVGGVNAHEDLRCGHSTRGPWCE